MKAKVKQLKKNICTISIIFTLLITWMINIKANLHPEHITDNKPDNYIIADSIISKTKADNQIADSLFNVAVEIIKKYEGWHTQKNYPYVGYGHKLLPSDTFNWNISEEFATKLLKQDLKQKCSVFREFGKDSLLLGVLAYNIGEYKIKGGYGYKESELARKLRSGDREIYHCYISHCRWNGKEIKSIKNRRIEEYNKLFNYGK